MTLVFSSALSATLRGLEMQAVEGFYAGMTDVALRSFTAADRDWLVDTHQELYARNDGFDSSFGLLVGEIADDFLATRKEGFEAGWIAESDGKRLGSIFCVRLDDTTAKLRLFLVVPEARGQGLGKRLLHRCMMFAKDSGYRGMQLWTHRSHAAACALYVANGWRCVDSKPVHSFGQDLIEETYVYWF